MAKYTRRSGRSFRWWLFAGTAAAAVAVAALFWLPDSEQYRNRRPGPSGGTGAASGAATSGAAASSQREGGTGSNDAAQANGAGGGAGEHKADEFSLPAMQKLVGRWRRRDADYVLKVDAVDERGEVKVAYLNPNPIQVGKASAHSHGDAAHLTVELRDFNYPGCIYDLNYDPKTGVLRGTYFQAALGETYDVEFVRAEGS